MLVVHVSQSASKTNWGDRGMSKVLSSEETEKHVLAVGCGGWEMVGGRDGNERREKGGGGGLSRREAFR